ncbi:MAG: DUF1730 domain-containing protein, partial [Candidatus Marinimicrobia bacterium]|nr:DUF1730 domain-containing protein [Candidatus Neomarinimicrobiota bacterium]
MFEFSHDALDKICVEQKIDLWGIAPTALLNDEVAFLEKWLSEGKHGDMHWLEDHLELRRNPAEMFAGTQSILMIGISYYSAETEIEQEAGNNSCRVAKYVTKVDYHHYLKKLLYSILKELQKINPDTEGRPFTDSAPVMEKVWAQKAGLGWIGKNSLLINKRFGSYVFLGGLMLNCTFDSYDKQEKNNCGSCNACQNNCPTNA